MLTIIQARDFKPYSELVDKLFNEQELPCIAEAIDNEKVLGFIIYHFEDEKVIIDYVDADKDLYLYDGLVRSVLFLAMNNEIEVAEFRVEDKTDLKKLGFVKDSDNLLTSIDSFMSNCKNCKK